MKKLKKKVAAFFSKNFHFTRKRLLKAATLGLVVGILGLLISPFQFAMNLEEDTGLGLLFKLRGPRKPPADVVVVSIDKQSSDRLDLNNNPDKWPRSLHAQLTENLTREGARVVAFDVHFIEPKNAEDDNLFAQSLQNAQNVILTEPLVPKELPTSENGAAVAGFHNIVKIVKPFDLLADAALATAPFTLPRIPFKVNRYWTFQTSAGDSPTVPVVAFQLSTLEYYDELIKLLEKFSPDQVDKLPSDREALASSSIKRVIREIHEIFQADPLLELKLLAELETAKQTASDPDAYDALSGLVKMYGGPTSRYINYYGPPRTIKTIPYYQALQIRDGKYEERPMDLNGKAVFVGLSEILLADRKDSFYTVYSTADGIFVSGVEIMASVFANISDDQPIQPIGLKSNILLVLLWGILLGIACRISSMKIGALNAIALSIFYLAAAVYMFKAKNIWYPLVIPLFFQAPLAYLGAAAIEHGSLFKEVLSKLRMERDLSVARDIQMSMMPESCPTIEGYQIAASSTPAREVSGDFFDFIDIDDSNIGFVIADVTGKSVSGALVMTAAKSVFRLLSEEKLSVGDIMKRANKQIKKDITRAKGMFVALLYAVLNKDEKRLGMCSAGQTQPILLSAKTGEATLIETEGDAFPLGIIDDADYQETKLQLDSGDLAIFYTDGVVEAMNKKGKMYGFDRFLEVIKGNSGLDADIFLEKLINDINSFVGKAEQHDDLTIVVIKVD
ncbi:MAG TPA: SpoIIE family protein phosphatase [Desulfobulbales bacterium]|nr:SpoIIE family protein phosphatase [Desulfobulbales bacterium]